MWFLTLSITLCVGVGWIEWIWVLGLFACLWNNHGSPAAMKNLLRHKLIMQDLLRHIIIMARPVETQAYYGKTYWDTRLVETQAYYDRMRHKLVMAKPVETQSSYGKTCRDTIFLWQNLLSLFLLRSELPLKLWVRSFSSLFNYTSSLYRGEQD